MESYQTVAGRGDATFVEKRSRFIGIALPIASEEQATEQIAAIRRQYFDARHTVFAYRLHDGMVRRYADDGEPQGTAGIPILDVMQKAGVEDCLVTVTRYFGGILLGTGGLVRAYSHTAALAIEAAGRAVMTPCRTATVVCPYPAYQAVVNLMEASGGALLDRQFGDTVTLVCRMPDAVTAAFERELGERFAGRLTVSWSEIGVFPVPKDKQHEQK